jgi:hypothetical protein
VPVAIVIKHVEEGDKITLLLGAVGSDEHGYQISKHLYEDKLVEKVNDHQQGGERESIVGRIFHFSEVSPEIKSDIEGEEELEVERER